MHVDTKTRVLKTSYKMVLVQYMYTTLKGFPCTLFKIVFVYLCFAVLALIGVLRLFPGWGEWGLLSGLQCTDFSVVASLVVEYGLQ